MDLLNVKPYGKVVEMTDAQGVMDRTETEQEQDASPRRRPSLWSYFLSRRKEAGFDRYDAIVFAIYAAILALAIRHHIAWADEAQAWLIARDSSLHELLFRRLHYEGAPALWPLILWIAIRLHLPYTAIGWLSGALALPGIYLLLRYSPFPRLFRWLLPFTFFLQYQYAVIARPYVLFPVLFFSLCIAWTSHPPRPLLVALFAGLIANVSAHGAIFASLLFAVYLKDLYGPGAGRTATVSGHRLGASAGLFSVLIFAALAVAIPAPDGAFAVKGTTSKGRIHTLLLKLMPEEQRLPTAIPLDKPLKDPYALKTPEELDNEDLLAKAISFVVTTIVVGASAVTYPIARSNLLAVAFVALWMRWLWSRSYGRYAALFFLGIFGCIHIWVYSHHTGLFLLVIIATAWLALSQTTQTRGPDWIAPAFAAVSLLVIVLQVGWTVHCVRAEASRPYDPGLATEQFLAAHEPGKRIAGFTFETVSTQPYSPTNLYINWPHSYFSWSNNIMVTNRRTEAAAMHPDVVVYGDFIVGNEDIINQWVEANIVGKHPYQEMLDFWQAQGYVETHRFCGDRFIRMGVSNTLCEVILEPVKPPETLTTPTANPAR